MIVRRVSLAEPHELLDLLRDTRPWAVVRPAATALIIQRPISRWRGPFVLMFFDSENNWLRTQWFETLQLALDEAAEVASVRLEDWQVVSEPFGRAPTISARLLRELSQVPPSKNGAFQYRPSRVRLRDGSWRDGVYLQDLETYLDQWGSAPGGDRRRYELEFGDVMQITDSPRRLPPHLANALYEAGESAMGGCYFVLVTRSGLRIPCSTGNLVDFIDLPKDVASSDIVRVEPHAEEGRTASHPARTLDIRWSVYTIPE